MSCRNVIYLSLRSQRDMKFTNPDFQAKYSAQVLAQNTVKCGDLEYQTTMASGQQIPKKEQLIVSRVDNLVYLNAYPLLLNPAGVGGPGKLSNIYQILKQSTKPYEALFNIIQLIIKSQQIGQAAVLSNVKNSFYLIDETNCSNKVLRNIIINYNIEQLLSSKIYGQRDMKFTNPDFQAKYSAQVLAQNTVKCGDLEYQTTMASGQQIPKKEQLIVSRVDNLVYLNAYPLLLNPAGVGGPGKLSNIYQILKQSTKPYEALFNIIQLIIKSQQIGQAAVVIDCLELLEKFGQPGELIDFIKKVKNSGDASNMFPFYVHSDFQLIKNKQLQLQLQKLSNGQLRIEKESTGSQQNANKQQQSNSKYAMVYTTAVKPGERYVDETSVIQLSLQDLSVRLLGNKEEAMKHFIDVKKSSNENKPSQVKATFKIEINDEDKKVRDHSNTTLYHTGNTQPQIQLDQEDLDELNRQQLEDIDEGDGVDEDDEEDNDDPDEDLDF
eukprot:403351279